VIFWLYGDVWDDYYYRTWYGSGWGSYPEMQIPFRRPGVFYPTVAMRDLAMGVSEMPIREQANFRVGIIGLANTLEQKLSDGLATPVVLGRNDIVVTHYQMLEEAVVLDGFVSADARQFPFKALLDLQDPNGNLVFVPATSDGEPTPEQLAELQVLNERILQLGGSVDDGTKELP
ncbi:MAG: hypothetical protein HY074_16285, partial [Deltaproteobacteria bacterium]|nr:hypothetical protein [Deltaproteobacteria bacterium]